MDFSKITDIEFDGIDYSDAMDFVDAYISDCQVDGRDVTEDELEEINEDSDYVYDRLMEHIF